MRCPSKAETLAAVLALLPRGRVWQSNEGGPRPPAWQDNGSVLYRFWSAIATGIDAAHQRICALSLEMFCATQSETNDLWMAEYGLPNPCDPFPDLCTKVSAIGGTRCDYFALIAARAGWSIECIEEIFRCSKAIAGRSRAGNARASGSARPSCRLSIVVHADESPSFVVRVIRKPIAGRLLAGQRLNCGPSVAPLECLLERAVPAHMEIDYRVI